jgi:hypothetical protein
MAVFIQYISVVVQISVIKEVSGEGGFETYLESMKPTIGECVWHDDHLLVESGMSPHEVEIIVNAWVERGLTSVAENGEQREWKDLCVVDHFKGPTLPCSWLEFDHESHTAWHTDHPKGSLVEPTFMDNEFAKIQKDGSVLFGEKFFQKRWWEFWK